MSEHSDDDWFDQDEEQIVRNFNSTLLRQVNKDQVEREEHIECRVSVAETYLKQLNLDASAAGVDANAAGRFTTAELAKAVKWAPLDMFIYFMSEERHFFIDQVVTNDSQKRLLLYMNILTALCQLELGGFDEQLLTAFSSQAPLLAQLKRYAANLFAPANRNAWDKESTLLLAETKWLLIRAHKMGILSEQGYELLGLLKSLITNCQLPSILEHPLCVELAQELEACSISSSMPNVALEIYPTLEELRGPTNSAIDITLAPAGDVLAYIKRQRQLLREDFVQPLREFVQRLLAKADVDALEAQGVIWPQTELVLNPDFSEAQRNSLIYVNLRDDEDKIKRKKSMKLESNFLDNLKTGALLCFTSNYEFENLILATVAYTAPAALRQGQICVKIVRQYNIGNIYNKQLLMFQTPAFFEPYLRVHNYLSTCSIDSFPMRRYIVDGTLETKTPIYGAPDTNYTYTYNGVEFTPAKPPLKLPFNPMQRAAFTSALSSDFCLMQGPPGTGKTHVSVELVRTLIENAKWMNAGPIIVLAYTNDSLDKFLLKVAQYTDNILRFGSQTQLPEIAKYNVKSMVDVGQVPPRLKRVWWLVSNEYKAQFELLQQMHRAFDGSEEAYQQILEAQQQLQAVDEKLSTLQVIFQYYVARDKSLIAMTTTCAARLNFLLRLLKSKIVIFEEAAEIHESHIVACLTPHMQQVIMIGDHKQLQPHTSSQVPQVSLFERLINRQFPVTVLNVQYRMRSCIASLLVPTIYDQLISDDSVLAYKDVRKMSKNLYFVTHSEVEQQLTDKSFVNDYEARELVKLARHLIHSAKYQLSDIVILSPYSAQVARIKTLLLALRLTVQVMTVDSFQGLEANIVLLSFVRSNKSGNIGFLRRPNRVCVALSRSRWALYMIGDMGALQRGGRSPWTAIDQQLRAIDCIGAAFPIVESTTDL